MSQPRAHSGKAALLCILLVAIGASFAVAQGPWQDPSFPPTITSIGRLEAFQPVDGTVNSNQVQWIRVTDYLGPNAQLFGPDGPSPEDIGQANVGNCWLLAAFACVAENAKTLIPTMFGGQATLSPTGMYTIGIYDETSQQRIAIQIDDMIPVYRGPGGVINALSAQGRNSVAWPMLLEKAFAKYMGSYQALEGGYVTSAFLAMHGNDFSETYPVHWYKEQESNGVNVWTPYYTIIMPTGNADASSGLPGYTNHKELALQMEAFAGNQIFERMEEYLKSKEWTFIIGAGTQPQPQNYANNYKGVYYSHAYTVTRVKFLQNLTLIKLRNPWGNSEWTGDWSDSSPLWRQYPQVARLVEFNQEDDGFFWMSSVDFEKVFASLDIVPLPAAPGDVVMARSRSGASQAPGVQVATSTGTPWSQWPDTPAAASTASPTNIPRKLAAAGA